MAASSDLVAAANPAMTEAEATAAISTYGDVAEARLALDDPGLPATLRDWCHALMICHLADAGNPEVGLSQHTSGDYSESRAAGATTWSIQYHEIIALAVAAIGARAEPAGAGVVRADADMGAVSLDQGGVPVFHDGVSM
jgi:hypothetical protein